MRPCCAVPLASTLLTLATSGGLLPGQGGITWPRVERAPVAVVVPLNDRDCDVYLSGCRTVPSPGGGWFLPGDDRVGIGLGLPPGSTRKVTDIEFDEEDDGDASHSGDSVLRGQLEI
jgi:hypothetical protein